jgi:hypothetical protein
MIPPEKESTDNPELWSLAEAVCNDTVTAEQYARLNAILLADEEAARRYATYVRMHGLLLWHWRDTDVTPVATPVVPALVETPSFLGVPTSLGTNLFSPGGYVFSYLLAICIVGIGLLIGWAYQMSNPRFERRDTVQAPTPGPTNVRPAAETVLVGRVTATVECQWPDPKTAVANGADVPLGREYAMLSGVMQITYNTGARVILQGPCTYHLESPNGGYLSLGRLTARVKKRGEGRGEKEVAANQQSAISNHKSPSPLSPLPSPSFAIRTPTAKIVDFGTEFGVEVDQSGVSRAHVYEGKVEMRAIGSGNVQPILLRADESARAAIGKNGFVALVRQTGRKSALLRELPKSVPIVLFNTGVGLKGGQADPHWQLAARSDDPAFKPQAAVVRGWRDETFLPDDARSQWISLLPGAVLVPQDVIYVFRTTFDLTGMLPSTAVVRGRFMGDDRIVAVRLNGRRLTVRSQRDTGPFFEWNHFQISSGFVRGNNVLEFDVLNSIPGQPPGERRVSGSRMSFRAELEGAAAKDPGLGGDRTGGTRLRRSAKQGQAANGAKSSGKDLASARKIEM